MAFISTAEPPDVDESVHPTRHWYNHTKRTGLASHRRTLGVLYPSEGSSPLVNALDDWISSGVAPPYANAQNLATSSNGITPTVESALLSLVQAGVRILEPGRVGGYLLRYPGLVGVLPFIQASLKRNFGSRSSVTLQLYDDPEIENEYLILYVRLQEYNEGFLETLDAVRSAYRRRLSGSSGRLFVSTDFQPPE